MFTNAILLTLAFAKDSHRFAPGLQAGFFLCIGGIFSAHGVFFCEVELGQTELAALGWESGFVSFSVMYTWDSVALGELF